jgi:hypothetical protein
VSWKKQPFVLEPGASITGFNESMVAQIPEPSTWAMMLLGFASLGFGGWRAQRKTAVI